MANETPVDLAYAHATENLALQRGRLDNLRARSATVIAAGSVLASFLGGQALADTKSVPGIPSPIPDKSLQLWEVVGCVAFLLVLALSAWIIKPKTKGWTFRLNAKKLLAHGDRLERAEELRARRTRGRRWWRRTAASLDLERVAQIEKRELVAYMEDYYVGNEVKIEKLFTLLQLSVILLAVEALGFMLDLTT